MHAAAAAAASDGACGFHAAATALNLFGAAVHFAGGIEMVRLWKRENLCLSVRWRWGYGVFGCDCKMEGVVGGEVIGWNGRQVVEMLEEVMVCVFCAILLCSVML